MPSDPAQHRLEQLQQKQKAIQDQIRREKQRLANEQRKLETRRKILVGAVILNAAETDADLATRLHALLNAQLTRNDDRALFELPDLPASNANDSEPEQPDAAKA